MSIRTLKISPERAKRLGIKIPEKGKKRSKHRNIPTTIAPVILPGITLPEAKFPSKLEARCYLMLCERWRNGEIKYFHRQVPIVLPGGPILRVDFQIIELDDTVEYMDAKGRATRGWLDKAAVVQECYGIRITLWP